MTVDVLALAGTPRHGTFDTPHERGRESYFRPSLSLLIEPGRCGFGGTLKSHPLPKRNIYQYRDVAARKKIAESPAEIYLFLDYELIMEGIILFTKGYRCIPYRSRNLVRFSGLRNAVFPLRFLSSHSFFYERLAALNPDFYHSG